MNTVLVMSGLATRGAFDGAILPDLERAGRLRARVRWDPTTVLMKAIAEGERADVVVLTDSAIAELAGQGVVRPETQVRLAQAVLGVGVPRGAPHPDVSTTTAFRQALLDARSVAYSKAGASGIYFEGLAERLGIAEEVLASATVIPAGFTGEKLVTGEADLAIQQISELLIVDGVEVVGPFPPQLQAATTFCAAIFTGCANPEGAEELIAALASPEAGDAYVASGLVACA